MADCCGTFLSCFFTSFCGREMSNGLTLTDLIIIIWAACVAGVKGAGGGVGRVRKKRRRGEKKEGGPLLLFLTLRHAPPPPHPLRLVLGVYYDHEKFKMFNTRIVNYRVRRFVFMPTLNSHWLDEKEERKSHHM